MVEAAVEADLEVAEADDLEEVAGEFSIWSPRPSPAPRPSLFVPTADSPTAETYCLVVWHPPSPSPLPLLLSPLKIMLDHH